MLARDNLVQIKSSDRPAIDSNIRSGIIAFKCRLNSVCSNISLLEIACQIIVSPWDKNGSLSRQLVYESHIDLIFEQFV